MKGKKIPDRWLLIPIILIFLNFIYRLIDESKLIRYFPFDYTNDVSSYMAQLHFLKVCGFHNLCPYWYNSFISFKFSPPGWYFLTLPLYRIFGDVKIATYISIVMSFLAAFLLIYFLYKKLNFSKTKRIAFFFFMFGNAIAIGNFIRLGRAHELLSWVLFLVFAFFILYYKDKKINYNFFWIIPFYTYMILTYQSTAVLSSFFILGLFLSKPKIKEKITISLSVIFSFIITSFWWFPFIKDISESSIPSLNQNIWLWLFNSENLLTNLASIIIPLTLITSFYFYWKEKKSKSELLLFLPILLLSIFLLFRITTIIPILKNIFPDPYLIFLLFFIIYFSLNINIEKFNKLLKISGFLVLIIISVISISLNVFHTPKFMIPGEFEENMIDLLPYVEGRFITLGNNFPSTFSTKALDSYSPIYNNLSSAYGWYPELKSDDYFDIIRALQKSFEANDCKSIKGNLSQLNISTAISYLDGCNSLKDCGLNKIKEKSYICLFKVIK